MSVLQACECLSCSHDLGLGLLLPHLAAVAVEKAEVAGDRVLAWVRARAGGAACPRCGAWSGRVHSGYSRRFADAATGGRGVQILLAVRRFFCGNAACPAVTFAEQPEGLAVRYARRTPLCERVLRETGLALAGRAGSRLAAVLAIEVSRDTLLRLVMALPDPPAGPGTVPGADDFSLLRGSTYATLLVDMDTGKPADLLPGREAATLEAWLKAHPGVQVICRDRAGAYAEGARAGAPDAIQVAGRWHIWHNLCEHARKAVARHQDCLGEPGPGDQQAGAPAPERAPDLETVIRQRHQAVHELRGSGKDLAATAAALGLGEQVTGRFWRTATAGDLLATVRAAPGLDPWKPYLRQRWDQGTTKIKALHAEITARGYAGSYSTTKGYTGLFRLAAPPRPPAPPRPGKVAGWILTGPASLDPGSTAALAALRARCPGLDALAGHVTEFAKILTARHGDQPGAWLNAVSADPGQPGLHSFATGIRQDYQAVRNGLTFAWNSGPVEGHNTRVKLLKRQMYGRASLPLLRKRILLTS